MTTGAPDAAASGTLEPPAVRDRTWSVRSVTAWSAGQEHRAVARREVEGQAPVDHGQGIGGQARPGCSASAGRHERASVLVGQVRPAG